jgi:hypothetical protein
MEVHKEAGSRAWWRLQGTQGHKYGLKGLGHSCPQAHLLALEVPLGPQEPKGGIRTGAQRERRQKGQRQDENYARWMHKKA